MHPYTYAHNNPYGFVDETGLDWLYVISHRMLYQVAPVERAGFDRESITSWSAALMWYRFEAWWPAVSGTRRHAPVPLGCYKLNNEIAEFLPFEWDAKKGELYDLRPFCDSNYECWFLKILPEFDTERTGLGMHPDGNKPGTEGCIGAKNKDCGDLLEALRKDRGPLTVVP